MRVARIQNGTVVNVEVWQNGAALPIDRRECPSEVCVGWRWTGLEWAPPTPVIMPVVLTPLDFLSRLTNQEKATIAMTALQDPEVAVWQMSMLAAGEIRSDDDRTIAGLEFAIAKGILTPERVAEVMS